MKFRNLALIFALLFTNIVFSQYDIDKVRSNDITEQEIYEHIKYLASDELEGRYPGTEGDVLARQYISREFEKYGLIPEGDSAFIQRFDMNIGMSAGELNSLAFYSGSKTISINQDDFTPLGISSNGKVKGGLVFAGYGINAPMLDYSDFKDSNGNMVNVEGKVIVIMRYSPTTMNFQNDKFAKYEELRTKIASFKDLKPAGVIIITPPLNNASSNTDMLMDVGFDMVSQSAGIPIINTKRSVIEKFLKEKGYDLNKIQSGINGTLKPNCFELTGISAEFEVDLQVKYAKTGNVLGLIEGSDPVLKNEVIIIGAHFDHLGYGGRNSMHQGKDKQVHNGADDNASGTTGVIELAQKLSSEKNKLKRSVLFLCFTGEEEGLIGSSYFVKSEKFKEFNTVAMINMDMIGRLKEDKLILNGTGTSPYWTAKIDELNKTYNFKMSYNPDGFGPSDHSSFYGKDIPVLMFFTDLHEDYHRPSDDIEKINTKGQEKVVKLVYDVVYDLSTRDSKPEFTKVAAKQEDNKGERKAVRVYVGTVPDFSSSEPGYKISGVQAGSPAEKAGILAGDVMIKFNGKDIGNLYDYTAALGDVKPGQEVDVVLKRGTEEITVKITLGSK
ncbi:MAG: M20/M25/M40 family metallo-hydrolase [Ignavibacteria bacterium]|nr:M20/M25/M40 family metallo-hydrolase [Ignavibacteria bacterium]